MNQPRDRSEQGGIPRDEWAPALTALVLLVLIAAMVLSACYLLPHVALVAVQGLALMFFIVVGKAITGRAYGILINEQLTMSVSRFQLALWTLVVLSGIFVLGIARAIRADVADATALQVEWQVWALLGLSAATLVAAPLVESNKKRLEPDPKAVERAGAAYGETSSEVELQRQGILYPNASIQEAKFTDMFQGDELANARLIDMGKLQVFFFTVIAVLVYEAQLARLLASDEIFASTVALPTLSEGLLALLGISHAGYLGSKSTPATSTAR